MVRCWHVERLPGVILWCMSARLSSAERAAIAQRELNRLAVASASEALYRYWSGDDGGHGESEQYRVDEVSGLPYRLVIGARRYGAEVHLGVSVWPLPEKLRAGGKLRVVNDFLEGWINAPGVRVKRLADRG